MLKIALSENQVLSMFFIDFGWWYTDDKRTGRSVYILQPA